jgi:hypothetical protein
VKSRETSSVRVGEHAAQIRAFVDALRLVLRKEPLYGIRDSRLTDTERFYVAPQSWEEDYR